jgi:hypothetical protein
MTERYNIEAFGQAYKVWVEEETYATGQPALQVYTNDEEGYAEPFGRLTVAMPGVALAPGEILLKTWSENEGWAEDLARKLGYEPIGRAVPAGFAAAEIWRKVEDNDA